MGNFEEGSNSRLDENVCCRGWRFLNTINSHYGLYWAKLSRANCALLPSVWLSVTSSDSAVIKTITWMRYYCSLFGIAVIEKIR